MIRQIVIIIGEVLVIGKGSPGTSSPYDGAGDRGSRKFTGDMSLVLGCFELFVTLRTRRPSSAHTLGAKRQRIKLQARTGVDAPRLRRCNEQQTQTCGSCTWYYIKYSNTCLVVSGIVPVHSYSI